MIFDKSKKPYPPTPYNHLPNQQHNITITNKKSHKKTRNMDRQHMLVKPKFFFLQFSYMDPFLAFSHTDNFSVTLLSNVPDLYSTRNHLIGHQKSSTIVRCQIQHSLGICFGPLMKRWRIKYIA